MATQGWNTNGYRQNRKEWDDPSLALNGPLACALNTANIHVHKACLQTLNKQHQYRCLSAFNKLSTNSIRYSHGTHKHYSSLAVRCRIQTTGAQSRLHNHNPGPSYVHYAGTILVIVPSDQAHPHDSTNGLSGHDSALADLTVSHSLVAGSLTAMPTHRHLHSDWPLDCWH